MRPKTSNAPPAANGTIMVTGRVGQLCASAGAAKCKLPARAAANTAYALDIKSSPAKASLRTE
jgi:hypothetical protein